MLYTEDDRHPVSRGIYCILMEHSEVTPLICVPLHRTIVDGPFLCFSLEFGVANLLLSFQIVLYVAFGAFYLDRQTDCIGT